MKLLLSMILFSALFIFQTSYARTVEIDVHGMTCAFCVDNMTRQFNKMDSVSKVNISLKMKKIRLETDNNLPSIETINQTILEAGFTPVTTTVLPDEE